MANAVPVGPPQYPHPMTGLSERDQAVLAFEATWYGHSGGKEEAIRQAFGLSAARYYQLLNTVIDLPAALEHDPMLVHQLISARDKRTASRASRTFE